VQVSVPADDRIVLSVKAVTAGACPEQAVGHDAARGSVIAPLDDDDVWSPTVGPPACGRRLCLR
jgi:hypothetical protein